MKIKMTALVLVGALSACATPYKDPRTAAELSEDVAASLNQLIGEYEVVDARNDNFAQSAAVSVDGEGRSVNVMMALRNGSIFVLNGNDCSGAFNRKDNAGSLSCYQPTSDIIYFSIGKSNYARKIDTSVLLMASKPLLVEKGDYLLEYMERRGRGHYYLLKRK